MSNAALLLRPQSSKSPASASSLGPQTSRHFPPIIEQDSEASSRDGSAIRKTKKNGRRKERLAPCRWISHIALAADLFYMERRHFLDTGGVLPTGPASCCPSHSR